MKILFFVVVIIILAIGIYTIVGNPLQPQITNIEPYYGRPGVSIKLTGNGFSTIGNIIRFNGHVESASVASDGATLTFKLNNFLAPTCEAGKECSTAPIIIVPGAYKVSVENSLHKITNEVDFLVQ